MSYNPSDLIPRQTVAQLVEAHRRAGEKIKEGYALLIEAQDILVKAFTPVGGFSIRFNTMPNKIFYTPSEECEQHVAKRIKKHVWEYLINITGVKKMLTVERNEELSKNLESGNMPDISVETIFDLLMTIQQNSGDIRQEAVMEAYKLLNPQGWSKREYKTNQIEGIGRKIILPWMVEQGYYGKGKYKVGYRRTEQLNIIDRAFHILDAKPWNSELHYEGELVDAINSSEDGTGETDYFEFKAFKNRNLHLKFKRPDLVDEFNRVAGAETLPTETREVV